MTQGIYRFDPEVYDAVAGTPITGDLPSDLLFRLPEWCVYIEMDGSLHWGAQPVRGFWAHLEYDLARGGARELRIVIDCAEDPGNPLAAEGGLCPMPLLLGDTDITTALNRIIESGRQEAEKHNMMIAGNLTGDALVEVLRPMISLLLYLCSRTAEFSRFGRFEVQPGNPQPKRTRRHGWRLFPADGPAEWDVGVRMGAALRAAYRRVQSDREAEFTARRVRAHIRRAHWHTFLSGRRKRDDGTFIPADERRHEFRWLPPIPVNLEDDDKLPATIRKLH
ncbi:MAG: hypothetical protein JXR29_06725 [Methylothermaceae bacterium]|nr:hypothetical protein [Methylothermaceae bacterium]